MSEKHGISVRFRVAAPKSGSSSVVERLVANEKIVGSSPISRSKMKLPKGAFFDIIKNMLKGLTEKEVEELRQKFGQNILPQKDGPSWSAILLSQFKSPLIYIIGFVAIFSLFLGEHIDAALAVVVVFLNVGMGFYQEYSAQKTLIALRKILKPSAIVIREGKRKKIGVKKLVPGDLVLLGSGDKIPADGKLIKGVNLLVDEAILTGESEAVAKDIKKENKLFMGTTIMSGEGIMEVKKIGKETEVGKIGESLSEIKEEKTPLQKKLEEFSKNLGLLILAVCCFIFIFGILQNEKVLEMLRMSVILAVAAIPEGLPIAITVILALGMRRILKRQGLVKKLLSIETLGATSVICTDKTGTLTEGIMKVVKADLVNKEKAFLALTLTNEQKSNLEIAIWNYIKKESILNPQEVFDSSERIYLEPFDSEKKHKVSINKIKEGEVAFMLGGPEIILPFCDISKEEKERFMLEFEKWADMGLRVLGVAIKETGDLKKKKDYSFLGLLGVNDPIRREAKESIMIAKKAGIKIKIVTGDYRKTGERVAKNLGFKIEPENVMEGKELEKITEKDLKNKIDNILLFTRVTPHQKLKIVKVLQEKGEVVAMTGDGVNDALALKKSDIGVVVGNACDVAKESGRLVLLDSNFKTIVAACEEGRLIFSNIKKVVAYILSNSFVEIFLIFGAFVFNFPAPLTIVQILWIHLICDGPPDIVLGFEPKEKGIMDENPKRLKKESILSGSSKFLIFSISFIIGIMALFLFWYFNKTTGNIDLARTMVFASLATVDLVYVFSFKSLQRPIIKDENFFKNKYLFLAIIYGFILTFTAIYVPFFSKALKTVPLYPTHWLLVFGVGILATLWVEISKAIFNKKNKIN